LRRIGSRLQKYSLLFTLSFPITRSCPVDTPFLTFTLDIGW
jgi:hypothetical protein